MEFFSHSANAHGRLQPLAEHLSEVARRARGFAAKFGGGELAYWGGLWHDVGKFTDEFQRYISDPSRRHRGPDHSSAGAVLAFEVGQRMKDAATMHVAFPVAGHHTGLPDRAELDARVREKARDRRVEEALRQARRLLPGLEPTGPLMNQLPPFVRSPRSCTTLELFLRMVFSAVKDADYLDTEAHFSPEDSALRGPSASIEELWRRFRERHPQATRGPDTSVNRLRRRVYGHCLEAAGGPQGVYRLTVPTGGGKTLSALAFALHHALKHRLDRVIVAIPYTSIIEQTAQVYRSVLGDDAVLEHHSQTEWDDESEDLPRQKVWARLASENWDAPVVVTTTVQLFESLFSNRPGACRKLHNIARSVLVLDEVQTLPPSLLEPILDVLQELVDHYSVTLVLASATLPAYESLPYDRLREAREIVPHAQELFRELRRVRYEFPAEPWSWDRVAQEMRAAERCMAVVNTRGDALALLQALDDPEALHMSRLLCGAHRREVLEEVRRRLKKKRPCRLVATQVVEAGVDLDFPLVLRAFGPLDRLVQAAGRCNREGQPSEGRVVVFHAAEGGTPPGPYRTGADVTRRLLREGHRDVEAPETHRLYFRRLFRDVVLDSEDIQGSREKLDYPKVAERFRFIAEDAVPVVVYYSPHEDRVRRLVDAARKGHGPPLGLARRLGPYLVDVPRRQVGALEEQGLVRQLTPYLWEWLGHYDPVVGIGHASYDPDRLVV